MSRRQLVEGYLGGQMSRRVFMRGLIATGVTAGAAVSFANILEAAPAGAVPPTDFYLVMIDNAYQPPVTQLQPGQGVEFVNHGDLVHDAADITGMGVFATGSMNPEASHSIPPPPGAGNFKFHDSGHATMVGHLMVPVVVTPTSGPLGTQFAVRWAYDRAPSGLVFDIQRKAPGTTTWADWRVGITSKMANVVPQKRGTWSYRARVRKPSAGGKSGWSTVKTFQVT